MSDGMTEVRGHREKERKTERKIEEVQRQRDGGRERHKDRKMQGKERQGDTDMERQR